MTSGNFRTIAISEIVIDRERRQRRELTGLEELAESIATVGLINVPVIDRNNVLIAGERRLTACRDILNWTHIPVQDAESLDPAELHLIELEENVKRVDLPWQDQCRAMAEYHEMRAKLDPDWNQAKTARALGVKDAEVSNRLSVSHALAEGDPLVSKADKYSVALGITQRKAARKKDTAADSIKAMLSPAKPADEELEPELHIVIDQLLPAVAVPFQNIDFGEWALTYSGTPFNFIHCDFPYGVNAESHAQGAGQAFGTYEDGEDVYWALCDVLEQCMDTIIAPSAHMMFWFSMDYYQATLERLTEMGWTVNPFPLVWHKSDNSGILPDPKRGPRRIYETAFLCSRGDRLVVQAVSNVFSAPNVKNIHMSEKNPDMLRHFFRMFVDETTWMLDPTMGSGNSVVVAKSMQASGYLGLELNPDFFALASSSYLEGLTKGQPSGMVD